MIYVEQIHKFEYINKRKAAEELDTGTLPIYFFTLPIKWKLEEMNDEYAYIDPLTSNDALMHHASIVKHTITNMAEYLSTTQLGRSNID